MNMIIRNFDETLANKSSKMMIAELYEHIDKTCASKDIQDTFISEIKDNT